MKDVVLNFMEVFMKMKKLFAMIMALTMLLFSNTQIFAKSLTIKMVTQQFEQCIRHQNYDTLLTL